MAKMTQREEFAVIKNEIVHIKKDVEDIKMMLKDHIDWESAKYEKLKEKFAGKWV